jgi:hypothetical protein
VSAHCSHVEGITIMELRGPALLKRRDNPRRADSRSPADFADSLLVRRLEDVEARFIIGHEGRAHVTDRRAFARELLGGHARITPGRAGVPRA